MLPFLKNRDDGVGVGPAETVTRKPDEDSDLDMLDAVASDLLSAIEKKDKKALKAVLEAFAEHIQSMDLQLLIGDER